MLWLTGVSIYRYLEIKRTKDKGNSPVITKHTREYRECENSGVYLRTHINFIIQFPCTALQAVTSQA